MKTVVTGAKGFIGKNLVLALRRAQAEVAELDVDSPADAWPAAVRGARVVFHLAGVNRPRHEAEFVEGNVGSLDALLSALDQRATAEPTAPRPTIVFSSSTQAAHENPYGRSKLAAERALEDYSARTGTPAVIYRLPGVFGKWCRPNYNSVVATFCHNIARDLPITITDPARVVELVHVDDVVAQFMTHLDGEAAGVARGAVSPVFTATLGDLAERIRGFRAMRHTLLVPDASDPFTRRLLGTFTVVLAARRPGLFARAAHGRAGHAGRAAPVPALRPDVRVADAPRRHARQPLPRPQGREVLRACGRRRHPLPTRCWGTRSPSIACRGRTSRWWTFRRA